ncbi:hypothetical protein [Candidatus Nanosynbacter sp. HMT-352]|jgi:hypothetical protein|uniref:hypothetical protein n=1 Tax=Candidatus Nanosynbacter sp. HMT-352 TaxID=2899133 RepID=UPI001E37D293|nr:hypothetical protein [Candidatus Nanosynbacter sp. HMT-352]UHA57488.1 hypothetical protein LR957_00605 [Candidatus Nanosynbacter sp. HMT-352]
MRECKGDSHDLAYENTDKLALCDVGKSPELVQCIEDLPEDMPANDSRVDLIVKSLFEIDTHPIEKPVSLYDLNELIKGNIAGETKISIYEGEWPDMRAIPESDIPLPVELFVAAPMIKDWREGRVSESKGGKSSRDIIRQYAEMDPKTSPPIRKVDIVVDSDGGVFLALQGDGAHRLCAAKMRGDREILCREISVVRLN